MSLHSPENHDFDAIVREHRLRELHVSKFFRASPATRESLEQWYFPGVVANSKVRQRLMEGHAEFLELREDEKAQCKIAASISRCHTILTSSQVWRIPQAHDYCRQSLFCSFCISQQLQRISEQFSGVVDAWREVRKMRNVQMHSVVFHPEWFNHDKRCSDVPRAFAAIAQFREQVGKICGRLNSKVKKSAQRMGPILWGIHCSQPKHTFDDQLVPMPHLHLCIVSGTRFNSTPLRSELRKLTEKMVGQKQPDPGSDEQMKATHYKKADSVTFDDDPEAIPEALTNFASYIGRTVKLDADRVSLLTALAGRAIQMYGGKRNCGILGIKGEGIRRRDPAAQASPTFSNKAIIYHRNFTGDEWYVRVYRNPACFADSAYDR